MIREVAISLEIMDGVSCLSKLVDALNAAGAQTGMLRDCDVAAAVAKTGPMVDGVARAIVLPSPSILRALADMVESVVG